MDRKIIAIGGGGIEKRETLEIDREIIRCSGKKSPRVLLLPTALKDDLKYCEGFGDYYGKELGCKVDFLKILQEKPTEKGIKEKIEEADILYVSGGNTLYMMNTFRKQGIDQLLIKAYESGTVMCGLSAGSMCWFKYGMSDARKFKKDPSKMIKVHGLGMIDALNAVHFDKDKNREQLLKEMMKKTSKVVAITLDNLTALEIKNDSYRIIKGSEKAKAYKVFWKRNEYTKEEIECLSEFKSLNELLRK